MAQCKTTGKTRYSSELEAKIVLARIQSKSTKHRKNSDRTLPIRVTPFCTGCGGYHLTHKELRGGRRIA